MRSKIRNIAALAAISTVVSLEAQTLSTDLYPLSAIGQETSNWDTVRAGDIPQMAPGWSTPVRLAVSRDGAFEESVFATPDGNTVYFMYYPGDELSAALYHTTPIVGPGKIYSSQKPFTTMIMDNAAYLTSPYYSDAGPSLDANGNFFYHSNAAIPGDNGRYLSHIYENGTLLPFNNPNVSFDNPSYCAAKDELWFDEGDQKIYVLRNAKAGGFARTPVAAPAPINSASTGIQESQPWLSADCNTLYFSSTRDHIGSGPYIYVSHRSSSGNWSTPQVVVKSNFAVGEPSLTGDMQEIFFEQILKDSAGHFTSNIFSSHQL